MRRSFFARVQPRVHAIRETLEAIRMKSWFFALVATAFAILFCASSPAQERAPVPIYDSTQIALDRYTVVKRLGVQGWRSGYYIESYGDVAAASDALLAQAAQLGADGLINVYCLDRSDRLKGEGYYCYGNAIKVKP
jgi:uncharacterized protein YbjQ (UPF0145 family)